MTLSKIFSRFDGETIKSVIVPTLDAALQRGNEPAIIMTVSGVLDKIGNFYFTIVPDVYRSL